MKNILFFLTGLTAIIGFGACEPEPPQMQHVRNIVYTVDEQTTTVQLFTEEEFDALLDRFCDYAESGSSVSFYNANRATKGASKESVTYSTSSRDQMKAWMRQMEDAGKTVTVTYDSGTGTYHGTAYANAPHPDPDIVTVPLFSVSASHQVTFATGNLQYCATTGEYRMAAAQYITLCVTSDTSWTDLFGQDTVHHLGTDWRLLTREEATYLLEMRFCSTVAGVENARYVRAKVADIHGLILFPDLFMWPDSVALPVGVNNNGFSTAEGWDDNDYSVADWQQIEAAGAVFLPGTNLCQYGYMYTEYADGMAAYWTSTPGKVLVSGPSRVGTDDGWIPDGHAIRYVRDVVEP